MDAHGSGAEQVDPEFAAQPGSLRIQVINNLHVIRQKSDRRQNQVREISARVQLADVIADVRP